MKEKSVENVAEEILNEMCRITSSDFGVIVFHEEEEVKKVLYSDDQY